MIYFKGTLWRKHKMPMRPYMDLFGVNALITLTQQQKKRVEVAVDEGIRVNDEWYLQTNTQLQERVEVSPGSNTVYHSERNYSHRLCLKKERSTEKYKKYRKLIKSSQLREE